MQTVQCCVDSAGYRQCCWPPQARVCCFSHLQTGVDRVTVETLESSGSVAPGKLQLSMQVCGA